MKIPMDSLRDVVRERGIAEEALVEAMEKGLASAYLRMTNADETRRARAIIDPETGGITVFAQDVELEDEGSQPRPSSRSSCRASARRSATRPSANTPGGRATSSRASSSSRITGTRSWIWGRPRPSCLPPNRSPTNVTNMGCA